MSTIFLDPERNIIVDQSGKTEIVKYLQGDRLFLLRDYDFSSDQAEVNIIMSVAVKKTLDLEVVTKGGYVSMTMNLKKWHSYLTGELNAILNLSDETGNATISNSIFLQVFKFDNRKRDLWKLIGSSNEEVVNNAIATNNLPCTNSQDCKKNVADDWGLIQLNVPRKNCSVVQTESLSRFWLFEFKSLT